MQHTVPLPVAKPLAGMAEFLSRRFAVFRYANYRLFFIGLSCSRIGDAMQFIASSWLVMRLSHHASSVLILAVCRSLPALIAGPLLGVAVDISNRRRVIIATDCLLGVITSAVPVLWWMGKLENWHIYLATVLMTTGRDFWITLSRSLVRQWVPESILLEANSTVSMANQFGVLGGGLLAGLLVMKSSEISVMFINGMTFFVSAACLAWTRDDTALHPSREAQKHGIAKVSLSQLRKNLFRSLADGWSFLAGHRRLKYIYAGFLVYFLRLPLANALLPIYTSVALKGTAGNFAVLDAADGFGGIVSGLFLPALSRMLGLKATILGGTAAISMALIFMGLSHQFWLSFIINFALGFLFHIWILFLTLTQREIPLLLQGRVHSLFDLLVQMAALALFALIGWAGHVPIRALYIIHGCVALPLICWLLAKSGVFARTREASYAL
jgi:DHA3 family macrolide efflux protein-like MFS transporter